MTTTPSRAEAVLKNGFYLYTTGTQTQLVLLRDNYVCFHSGVMTPRSHCYGPFVAVAEAQVSAAVQNAVSEPATSYNSCEPERCCDPLPPGYTTINDEHHTLLPAFIRNNPDWNHAQPQWSESGLAREPTRYGIRSATAGRSVWMRSDDGALLAYESIGVAIATASTFGIRRASVLRICRFRIDGEPGAVLYTLPKITEPEF